MKNKKKNKTNIISFPSSISKLERQVEAILFSASEPLDLETIENRVKTSSPIKKILDKSKGPQALATRRNQQFPTVPQSKRTENSAQETRRPQNQLQHCE